MIRKPQTAAQSPVCCSSFLAEGLGGSCPCMLAQLAMQLVALKVDQSA